MVLHKSYVTLELVKFSWIRLLWKSPRNSQCNPVIMHLICCITLVTQNLSGFRLLWLDKRCKIIGPRMLVQQSSVLHRPQSFTASVIHLSARSWQYRWCHLEKETLFTPRLSPWHLSFTPSNHSFQLPRSRRLACLLATVSPHNCLSSSCNGICAGLWHLRFLHAAL